MQVVKAPMGASPRGLLHFFMSFPSSSHSFLNLFFNVLFLYSFIIDVQLIYNVVLVLGIQKSDSLIHAYIPYFQIPFHLLFFSRSVVSDSLRLHGLQHVRLSFLHHLQEPAQTHVH